MGVNVTVDREKVYHGVLGPFSTDYPPLLVLHTDLGRRKIYEPKFTWADKVNASRIEKGLAPLVPPDMSTLEPVPAKPTTKSARGLGNKTDSKAFKIRTKVAKSATNVTKPAKKNTKKQASRQNKAAKGKKSAKSKKNLA